MRCWNCLKDQEETAHRCLHCDQALKPNAAQSIAGKRNIDYLLTELEQWDFLDPSSKARVRSVYQARQERLKHIGGKADESQWPISDWQPSESLESEPVLEQVDKGARALEMSPQLEPEPATLVGSEEEAKPEASPLTEPASPLEASATSPRLVESLVGEADIRWFHSLGALLVVAAVVGWLRSSWDSYGRALAGVLIVASPLLLHLLAHKLKKSVPLSSRLLAILANILTPPALLAVDVFGWLPSGVSSADYWTCALLVSAAILSWQASLTQEKVPLYVGALCAVMAGWSQGALATACFSLGLGFLFARDTGLAPSTWLEERKRVAFYAGSFGALATLVLFETSANPMMPIAAFTAALVFLHLPTLTGQTVHNPGARIFLQASFTIVGSLMMRALLDLSPGGVALYLLFAAALFLSVKPESDMASVSAKLAGALGLLALVVGFLSDIGSVAMAEQTRAEATMRFLFAGVGAVFFILASRRKLPEQESLRLFSISLFCLLGGWVHLFLYFALQDPIDSASQFLPLVASMPLFCCLLLLASRWGKLSERAMVEDFSLAITLCNLAICLLGRAVYLNSPQGWDLALLVHGAFAIVWERGWIVKPTKKTVLSESLPRVTVISLATVAFSTLPLASHSALLLCCGALLSATFLLKLSYSEAAWEAGWLAIWFSLFYPEHSYWLGATALLSFGFALAQPQRKAASLVSSCLFGTFVITQIAGEVNFLLLYLPCLFFALTSALKAKGEVEWKAVGASKIGFDVLLAAAILMGHTPTPGSLKNLTLCLVLAGLAGSFQIVPKLSLANRFLSPHSSLTAFSALILWSLWQTPVETGALLIVAGLFAMKLSHQHKWEVSNALLILGISQLPSSEHFLFDTAAMCFAIVISELFTLLANRSSNHISNLCLLLLAATQQNSFLWEDQSGNALLLGSLILCLRTVQQNLLPAATGSSLVFLWQIDVILGGDGLDLKLRLLPTAAVLILASLWRWKANFPWTRPALYSGLTLLTAPAFLQFASGIKLWENFTWTLLFGCSFLALSFVVPSTLKRSFRQAGGYTLTGWAVISLTRAALQLPWQAATLVIGLALVTIGVLVERRGRNKKPPG